MWAGVDADASHAFTLVWESEHLRKLNQSLLAVLASAVRSALPNPWRRSPALPKPASPSRLTRSPGAAARPAGEPVGLRRVRAYLTRPALAAQKAGGMFLDRPVLHCRV